MGEVAAEPLLLTVREAARVLRVRDSVAMQWLKDRGLVLKIAGRRRVVREDLLAAIRASAGADEGMAFQAPQRSHLREATDFWDLPT